MMGQTLGHYRIIEKLGEGGMGTVYKAEDTRLLRTVALKLLAGNMLFDPDAKRRIQHEARLAAGLAHPNICTVYALEEIRGASFIVMEFVPGKSLRNILAERSLPVSEALSITIQTGEALAAAHAANVVHGDIKPANVMVLPSGHVKVVDFGIARRLSTKPVGDQTTTDLPSGQVAGTLLYMAPECLKGELPNSRSDAYSFAVLLYQLATNRLPFEGKSAAAIQDAVLHEPPTPPRKLNPEISESLERVMLNGLQKDPAQRYANAGEMLDELKRLKEGLGLKGLRALPSARHGARPLSFSGALVAALAILVALGIWYGIRRSGARRSSPELAAQGGRAGYESRAVRSITILPFRNVGRTKNYDYFGVGLADVLSAKMTNAKFLEVRSAEGAGDVALRAADPLTIGRALHVDAVLSGSYQIEGGKLSFTYTLTDVHSNVQIAGNALEDSFTRALDVEHQLAQNVVDSLRIEESAAERGNLIASPTHENEAFQDYLRSEYETESFWKRPDSAQLARAEKDLNEALALDPGFTLARVSLAKLHWLEVFEGYAKNSRILGQALEEANLAIRQAPDSGEAYAARGLVEFQQGNLDGMRVSLKEALARSPYSALALYAAGFYYLGRGLADRSVEAFLRSRRLNPQLVRGELGFAYRYEGDFVKAEQELRQALDAHPEDLTIAVALGGVLAARGNLEEAAKLETKLRRRAPHDPNVQALAALVAVRQGKPFPIDHWLASNRNKYWFDAGYCANVAGVLAVAHRPAQALEWLRRGSELSLRNYPFLSRNPLYDNLRTDPQFRAFLDFERREWENEKIRETQSPLMPPAPS